MNITLTGNDPEGATLTFTVLTQPAHGTLTGTPPVLVYVPVTNFNGSDSFTFKMNDGQADSMAATISITITPVNDPPSAQAQNLTMAEDTTLALTLTGADAENDPLTFRIAIPPARGSLSGIAPHLTYQPATNFSGPDSFTFQASDGQEWSVAAAVSIVVQAVDDAPVANAQTATTDEDMPVEITLNGGDIEGETLAFTLLTGPAHGTLNMAPGPLSSEKVLYTPATNYSGNDSFTFTANDGQTNSRPATVTLSILPVNDVPVATAAAVVTDENVPVAITLAGTDVDGDELKFQVLSGPEHGTFNSKLETQNSNCSFTPATNY